MSETVLWGVAASPPVYVETANVTTDNGTAFDFSFLTNPWQPSGQSGECAYCYAYLQVSWSMSATVRVTPIVDGSSATLTFDNGDTLEVLRPTFTLDQQSGNLIRKSAVFAVPLARVKKRSGSEIGRWWPRGERLQLLIESSGALGIGELMLEGIEIEFVPVRKAIYEQVSGAS